ncbi:MAG: hypothetical protein LUF82_02470, partial [Clostridia bacterium]|nr:hypothetical protein [Clostridia bacterium]
MAFGKNKSGTDTKNMTKADVKLQREAEIIKRQNDLSAKVDKLLASDEQHSANHSADNEELIKRVAQENAYLGKQSTEIYEQLKKENAALRKEFTYISTQTENVYSKLSEDNAAKTDDLFSRMSAELAYMTAQITGAFESLDKKVEKYNAALNEKIDALSKAFEDGIAVREEEPEEALDDEQLSIEDEYLDYDELAVRIADRLAESNLVDSDAVAEKIASLVNVAEIDYDELAYKIADSIPPQEAVSADDIASRVAEQLVIPEAEDAEYEELADESAEEITEPAEEYAAIDAEALANDIAHKVSELTNDEFDIVLDDAGCDSLAAAVVQKLDYDMLADKIAQRIATEKLSEDHSEFDYDIVLDEEGLRMITDSLTAELVSVCGSEFDGVNGRLDEANEKLDGILGKEDAIYTEAASNGNCVSEVKQDVEEIKEILAAGVVLAQEETAATTAEALEEEPEEEPAEEQPVEEIAEEPAEEVAEEAVEEAAEEAAEEVTEEPAEEVAEEAVEEIAEEPAEEVVEEVAEEPAEEPAEEVAEEPAEEVAEEAAEEPAEEAVEE